MPLTAKAQNTRASEIINSLRSQGWTKYKIAKELQTSWRTVHNWSRCFFEPSAQNLAKLINLTAKKGNE